jgi:hypothetical protein
MMPPNQILFRIRDSNLQHPHLVDCSSLDVSHEVTLSFEPDATYFLERVHLLELKIRNN